MKNFIRWLCRISGVEEEISLKEREHIGGRLINDAYWFSGGIAYKEGIIPIANILTLYGESFIEKSYPDVSTLRDTIYRMKEQNLSVFKDREVYGYWSDEKEPHFIEKKDYNQELSYKPLLRIKYIR